jgi:hypothetical protein
VKLEELRLCMARVKDKRNTEAGKLSKLVMEISTSLVDLGTRPV